MQLPKNFFVYLLITSIAYSFSSKTVCKKNLKNKNSKTEKQITFCLLGINQVNIRWERCVFVCLWTEPNEKRYDLREKNAQKIKLTTKKCGGSVNGWSVYKLTSELNSDNWTWMHFVSVDHSVLIGSNISIVRCLGYQQQKGCLCVLT